MFPSQISMSSAAQFCISWVSYKNCISKGFSRFQQDGEFVDMTIAADGYLVKVHQNIVALASPYLKAMIQSTPCQHPVVFLNNITQEMLCFILEYIYTGEVKIPTDSTSAFIEACKALHIIGVEHLLLPKKPEPEPQPAGLNVPVERLEEPPPPPPGNNFAAHITISSDNFNVEVIPNENSTRNQQTQLLDTDLMNYQVLTDANVIDYQNNCEQEPFSPLSDCKLSSPHGDIDKNQNKSLNSDQNCQNITLNWNKKEKEIPPTPPSARSSDKPIPPSIGDRDKAQHYSLSERGSLQLLLNRFMYYCHHHSCGGRKRRWRCIDYRKLRCPAIIDTNDGDIINRSEDHIHTDHDSKILRKFKSKKVFTTLSQAEKLVTEKQPRVTKRKRSSLAATSRCGIVNTFNRN